jgi:hypothetical protein
MKASTWPDETPTRAVPDFDATEARAAIQALYREPLSDDDLRDAATNLLMFFSTLLEEDQRRRAAAEREVTAALTRDADLPDEQARGITSP